MDIHRILDTDVLSLLLADKSSGRRIIWGTDSDDASVYQHTAKDELGMELFDDEHAVIKPRVFKEKDEQTQRTRNSAEVYTPSWICNIQNNMIDEKWFGRTNVFNTPSKHSWKTRKTRIDFDNTGKTWKEYVDAKRLEISCGEAPYIVSFYDAVSGKEIPLSNRIGLLDRKLRVVNENATSDEDWNIWALRALESVYGYEFQGDNLILARINVFASFVAWYL